MCLTHGQVCQGKQGRVFCHRRWWIHRREVGFNVWTLREPVIRSAKSRDLHALTLALTLTVIGPRLQGWFSLRCSGKNKRTKSRRSSNTIPTTSTQRAWWLTYVAYSPVRIHTHCRTTASTSTPKTSNIRISINSVPRASRARP